MKQRVRLEGHGGSDVWEGELETGRNPARILFMGRVFERTMLVDNVARYDELSGPRPTFIPDGFLECTRFQKDVQS